MEKSDKYNAMDSFYSDAYQLISSEKLAKLSTPTEEDAERERYGQNQAGQRMLLARRLVEAGVRFVSLTYGGWDHHQNIEAAFQRQGPDLDKALRLLSPILMIVDCLTRRLS